MSAPVGAVPSSCCKRDGSSCVCAKEATCSCGKQKALHCTCEKASTENKVAGATCSCGTSQTLPPGILECPLHPASSPKHIVLFTCPAKIALILILLSAGQRAAGACTCNRASEENTVSGDKCACGKRSSSMYIAPFLVLSFMLTCPAASCTCAGAELGQSELETDFTTKK